MDEVQHDEETLFNRASFAKLKKSEASFRLENFFIGPRQPYARLLIGLIHKPMKFFANLKASTSFCFNSIRNPCR